MGKNQMDGADASRLYITCLTAVLFYEFFSTVRLEWTYIWRPIVIRATEKRIRGITGLISLIAFFIVRYFTLAIFASQVAGLFMDWSSEKCMTVIGFQSYSAAFVISSATCLLSVRVLAIYSFDRRILTTLALLCCIQATCLFYASAKARPLDVEYCAGGSSDPVVLCLYWLSPMLCDLALVVLTLSRAFVLRRRNIRLGTVSLVVKSGIFYCAGTFFCNLMSASFDLRHDSRTKPITSTLALMGTSILCCRTSFSMAKHALKLAEEVTSNSKDGLLPCNQREKSNSSIGAEDGKSGSPIWSDGRRGSTKKDEEDWRERRLRTSVQEDSASLFRVESSSGSIFRKARQDSHFRSSRSDNEIQNVELETRNQSRNSFASTISRSNSQGSFSERQSFHSLSSNNNSLTRPSRDLLYSPKLNDARIKSTSTIDSLCLDHQDSSGVETVQSSDSRFETFERAKSHSFHLEDDDRFPRTRDETIPKDDTKCGKRKRSRIKAALKSNSREIPPIHQDMNNSRSSSNETMRPPEARNHSRSNSDISFRLVIDGPSSPSRSSENENSNSTSTSTSSWFRSSDMAPPFSHMSRSDRKHQRTGSSAF